MTIIKIDKQTSGDIRFFLNEGIIEKLSVPTSYSYADDSTSPPTVEIQATIWIDVWPKLTAMQKNNIAAFLEMLKEKALAEI